MLILLYAIDGEVFAARGSEWPNSLVLWFQGKKERDGREGICWLILHFRMMVI